MGVINFTKHVERKTRRRCAKLLRQQKPEDIAMAIFLESLAQFLESDSDF